MTRNEFMEKLTEELRRRRVDDAAEVAEEYEQHFAFKLADGYSEEEIAARLGVPEELVNQILGSGAVREYQEEQLHSLASYAAKAVSEKIMKGIAFFLTLVLAVVFVTIAVKIVELIAEIPGISFLNRMGGAGLGVVRAVLWIWIFFAVVYCFQATHWGNVCMKQIQGDPALAWLRENNPVLLLLKNVL